MIDTAGFSYAFLVFVGAVNAGLLGIWLVLVVLRWFGREH